MFISFHLPKAFQTQDNLCYLRSLTALTLPGSVFSQHQEQTQSLSSKISSPTTLRPYHGTPTPLVRGWEQGWGLCLWLWHSYSHADTLFQSTRGSFLLSSTTWKQQLLHTSRQVLTHSNPSPTALEKATGIGRGLGMLFFQDFYKETTLLFFQVYFKL